MKQELNVEGAEALYGNLALTESALLSPVIPAKAGIQTPEQGLKGRIEAVPPASDARIFTPTLTLPLREREFLRKTRLLCGPSSACRLKATPGYNVMWPGVSDLVDLKGTP